MRAARERCDVVIATAFVNPRQFNLAADLAAYPHTPDEDAALAEANGVDVWVTPELARRGPSVPSATPTTVSVAGLTESLEGAGGPGHFDGVASVVTKLFVVTGPCCAFFGEKDFQQLAGRAQLVADLGFDVTVRAVPIVRDGDGLALSSRNRRLSEPGRQRALAVSRLLLELAEGEHTLGQVEAALVDRLGVLEVAYVMVVEPTTLAAVDHSLVGEARILVAVIVDGVRLLDNGPVQLTGESRATSP
jgi:pantoate--beta-alanine ligase